MPTLCYVTDRKSLPLSGNQDALDLLVKKIAAVVAAGADWIQIREKDLSGKAYASLVREANQHASMSVPPSQVSTRLIVNDRLDVALAEHAGGVQLGEDSIPAAAAKGLILRAQQDGKLAADFLLGASCHSVAAAQSAAEDGADYVFFGPVFATPSKAAYGTPLGLDRLAEVCAAVKIPVLAIGGITLENAGACLACGAAGIAAIRLFQDAPHPEKIISALRHQR